MNRDEIVPLRKALIERIERLRVLGDYSAGAEDIRETAEIMLKVIDHLLEGLS